MIGIDDKRLQIYINREALRNLDKKEYPALSALLFKLWRGKLFATLEYYWQQQDTIPNQHLCPGGYYEFFQSRRYSAKKGYYVSADHRDWQYRTILLHCLGLITVRRPAETENLTSIEQQSVDIMYEKMIANNDVRYHAITYITTELWSVSNLPYSEMQAQKWIDQRIPVKYITKEAIINVFGEDTANEAYCDDRGIPAISEERKLKLKQAVETTIKRRNYTTKERAISKASKSIGKIGAERTWAIYGKDIMQESGYSYHRPTNTDKITYGINRNNNTWIITKKANMLEADE